MRIVLPVSWIARIVAEVYGDMSVRDRILFVFSVLGGGAVGFYGYLSSHAVVSSVFLGIAAFTLVGVVGLLLRAAAVLADPREIVEPVQATGRRKKELEREKAVLLKALKELEFDHEMGKVSDADFREIGGQYRARAMRVLRQLDEQGADYKALVEKELKTRLGLKKDDEPAPEKEPEKEKSTRPARCASCGTTNDSDAVFCKKCGKKVAA